MENFHGNLENVKIIKVQPSKSFHIVVIMSITFIMCQMRKHQYYIATEDNKKAT